MTTRFSRRSFLSSLAILGTTPVWSKVDLLAWQDPGRWSGEDLDLAHSLLFDPAKTIAAGAVTVHPDQGAARQFFHFDLVRTQRKRTPFRVHGEPLEMRPQRLRDRSGGFRLLYHVSLVSKYWSIASAQSRYPCSEGCIPSAKNPSNSTSTGCG